MGVRRVESPKIPWPTPKKEMVGPNKQKHENKHLHQVTEAKVLGIIQLEKRAKTTEAKWAKRRNKESHEWNNS